MELHPYLKHFDYHKPHKYLIIGTFPPKKELRKGKLEYFYGNKNSLWSILEETRLFEASTFKDFKSIRSWENKFSVGVVDVLKTCKRKEEKSSDDTDLIITKHDLNHELKDYILKYKNDFRRIYFTSNGTTRKSNSALYWFKQLMGILIDEIPKSVLCTTLPSPSGKYLTSKAIFLNKPEYGLSDSFLTYLRENECDEAIEVAKLTFIEKQKQVQKAVALGLKASSVKVPRLPNVVSNYPAKYRMEKYKDAFKMMTEDK